MKKTIWSIAAITTAALMMMSIPAFAQEPEEAAKEETTAETTAAEEKTAEKNEVVLSFVNNTGKDIAYVAISEKSQDDLEKALITAAQEALIEQGVLDDVADGLLGPKTKAAILEFREKNNLPAVEELDDEMMALLVKDYDDGNLLEEVIKDGDTFQVTYKPEEKEDQEDAVTFIAVIRFDGEDEQEVVLHELSTDMNEMTIGLSDEIGYVEYTDAEGTSVSTLETEEALLAPPVSNDNYGGYDDYSYDAGYSDYGYSDYGYDDYGYSDYGTDAGYVEPSYTEPVYTEPVYTEPVQENAAQGADGCIGEGALVNP